MAKASPPGDAFAVFKLLQKPRRVCVRRRKESPIIFFGGMYGGENTARATNVRGMRLRRISRALQWAAVSSNESPAQRVSLERTSVRVDLLREQAVPRAVPQQRAVREVRQARLRVPFGVEAAQHERVLIDQRRK